MINKPPANQQTRNCHKQLQAGDQFWLKLGGATNPLGWTKPQFENNSVGVIIVIIIVIIVIVVIIVVVIIIVVISTVSDYCFQKYQLPHPRHGVAKATVSN